MQIIAKTFWGLEKILAKEIAQLGGKNIKILKRAVVYEGNKKLLYRSVYELRTALRILRPFHSFKTKHENHLYKKISALDWTAMMNLEDTFVINAFTASKYMDHSKYLALKVKDAIVDQFRSKYNGRRLSIDRINPDFYLNIHLGRDNVCTLSWDASGGSLHRRGYRVANVNAPINEVLAAGMVLATNWQRNCDFIDPMCGSGTILIEAASYAHNLPPQQNRSKFGFLKWKDYDEILWQMVQKEADAKQTNFKYKILGFDKDLKAIKAAASNILAAKLDKKVEVHLKAFKQLTVEANQGILLTNPPYDERMQVTNIHAFYKEMGHILKHRFTNFDVWMISSNIKALKQLRLRPTSKKVLFNGSLECQFVHYELYEGSKKQTESASPL